LLGAARNAAAINSSSFTFVFELANVGLTRLPYRLSRLSLPSISLFSERVDYWSETRNVTRSRSCEAWWDFNRMEYLSLLSRWLQSRRTIVFIRKWDICHLLVFLIWWEECEVFAYTRDSD
jgi:hypothetical protein